jgi:hypothetical protein
VSSHKAPCNMPHATVAMMNKVTSVSCRLFHDFQADELILRDPWVDLPCQERTRLAPEALTIFRKRQHLIPKLPMRRGAEQQQMIAQCATREHPPSCFLCCEEVRIAEAAVEQDGMRVRAAGMLVPWREISEEEMRS